MAAQKQANQILAASGAALAIGVSLIAEGWTLTRNSGEKEVKARANQAESVLMMAAESARKAAIAENGLKRTATEMEKKLIVSNPWLALQMAANGAVEVNVLDGDFKSYTPDGQGVWTYFSREGKSWLWSLQGEKLTQLEGVFRDYTPDEQEIWTYSESDSKSRLWKLQE